MKTRTKVILIIIFLLIWGGLVSIAIYWELVPMKIILWVVGGIALIGIVVMIIIWFVKRKKDSSTDEDIDESVFFGLAIKKIENPPYCFPKPEMNHELQTHFIPAGNPPVKIYHLKIKQRDRDNCFDIFINTKTPTLNALFFDLNPERIMQEANNLASTPEKTFKKIIEQYDQFGKPVGRIEQEQPAEEKQESEEERTEVD